MSSPSFNLNFVLSIIPASFQKGLSPAVGYEEADGWLGTFVNKVNGV